MAYLNQATGDYRDDNSTLSEADQAIVHTVYIRLATRKGSYWADRNLGSRLHELRREKDTPRNRQLARQYAMEALKPVVDARRWKSMSIELEPTATNFSLAIGIELHDGRNVTVYHKVAVGG